MRIKNACKYSFIVCLLLCCGCSLINKLINAKMPSITFKKFQLKSLSTRGLGFECILSIKNPNTFAISLADINYDLDIKGENLAKGALSSRARIPAGGSKTVSLPFEVGFKGTAAILKGALKTKEKLPYDIGMSLGFKTSLGMLKASAKNSGRLPALTLPDVKIEKFDVQSLSLTSASGSATFKLQNASDYEIEVGQMDLGLSIGSYKVLSKTSRGAKRIKPKGGESIEVPFNINFLQAGRQVMTILKGQSADFNISSKFNLRSLGDFQFQEKQRAEIK
jgi:LEA14-like dessication related protein